MNEIARNSQFGDEHSYLLAYGVRREVLWWFRFRNNGGGEDGAVVSVVSCREIEGEDRVFVFEGWETFLCFHYGIVLWNYNRSEITPMKNKDVWSKR